MILVGIAFAQPTADLVKKGIDAYKAGKYEEAAGHLEKAYAAEPKPETLFALAQAERLAGKCDKAVPRYKQLLSQTTELATAKAVQNNLALCPGGEPPPVVESKPDPKPDAKPDVKPDPKPDATPVVQTKTVVREVRKTDGLAVALVAGGALGGGFAIGMFLRSSSARDDAGNARTLDAANALNDRADRDRLIAIISGGVSALAIGYGVYRLTAGSTKTTEVAITPTTGGSMMVFSGRF